MKTRDTGSWRENETGAMHKDWRGRISVGLAFPNTYGLGMSNLGFQTLYRIFNAMDHVVCERVFISGAPDRKAVSLESGRVLSQFDILAFSLCFENDSPGLLGLLHQGGVPVLSGERDASSPLVVAGGILTSINPEPLAPFVDAYLLGEAEALVPAFMEKFDPERDRREMLRDLAMNLAGVYVPAFYQPRYCQDGALEAMDPEKGLPEQVKKAVHKTSAQAPACSSLLSTATSFENTYLVEVSRGCAHGCRFCAAGYLTRPVRFSDPEVLKKNMDQGLADTKKIGLLGAAVSDLPGLDQVCRHAMEKGARLSFSSFRADAMNPEMARILAGGQVKTATLAPDAGSERMRRIIKKGITEQQVLDAAEQLVSAGILNLKLYFMVGLPWETAEDVEAIQVLVKKIKKVFLSSSRVRGKIGRIQVSLNCFVAKPFTPFQWTAMEERAVLRQKIRHVRQGLKRVANVDVSSDKPRWAHVQGLLARGDRRVGEVLYSVHKNQGNWPRTLKEARVRTEFYTMRKRPLDEFFPWEIIDHGIRKDFLKKEYKRAYMESE